MKKVYNLGAWFWYYVLQLIYFVAKSLLCRYFPFLYSYTSDRIEERKYCGKMLDDLSLEIAE